MNNCKGKNKVKKVTTALLNVNLLYSQSHPQSLLIIERSRNIGEKYIRTNKLELSIHRGIKIQLSRGIKFVLSFLNHLHPNKES